MPWQDDRRDDQRERKILISPSHLPPYARHSKGGFFSPKNVGHGRIIFARHDARMTYETRKVQGWRSRLSDEVEAARRDFWAVPVVSRQIRGLDKPKDSELGEHKAWFTLHVQGDRAELSARLRRLRLERQRRQFHEMTSDQRKAYNEYHRQRRAEWTPEQQEKYAATKQAWAERNRQKRRESNALYRERNLDELRLQHAIYAQLLRLANDDDQDAREARLSKMRAAAKARRDATKAR